MNLSGQLGPRSSGALAVLVAGAALAAILSGCAMVDRLSGTDVARALQSSGVAAKALILQVWDTGITVNDDPVIGLRVKVEPPDGAAYFTTIPKSRISRLDIPRFQKGETVPVRFDPQNPQRVALDVYEYR
jgi:Protein of unknown function (DUF3592)